MNTYFGHLEEALTDHQGTVPPANIYNYDETNITHNPAAKIVGLLVVVGYAEDVDM